LNIACQSRAPFWIYVYIYIISHRAQRYSAKKKMCYAYMCAWCIISIIISVISVTGVIKCQILIPSADAAP
jgi:hypothetical protein